MSARVGSEVVRRLREASRFTQIPDGGDFSVRLPLYMQGVAAAVAGGRAQVGDVARRYAGVTVCPVGCVDADGDAAPFTWLHVAFVCKGGRCCALRDRWLGRVEAFAGLANLTEPHAGAAATIKALRRGAAPRERTREELQLRRVASGMVAIGLNTHVRDCTPLVQRMVEAGIWLQLEGKAMTREAEREWTEKSRERRAARPWVARWQWKVARAGYVRRERLRELAEVTAWVGWMVEAMGDAGEMTWGERLDVEARLRRVRRQEVMRTRGAREPTVVQAVHGWMALAFLRQLQALRARKSGEGKRQHTARQIELAGTAYGTVWQQVPGWEEVCGGDGAVDIATAETALGGKGVAWRRTEGETWAAQGARAWRRAMLLGGRRAVAKWMGQEMAEGRAGDKRGRWAVEDLLDVRRPGGKGRRLEVEVAWEGEWDDEWVNVTQLTKDLRKRAREMEGERYGAAVRQCRVETRAQRAERRAAEREGDDD
jgi:hypothetical protein